MRLTDQEQCLLNGEEGEIKALAMSYLVKLGNAFDGEEMVNIAYAHMSAGSALREGEIEYLGELADKGAESGRTDELRGHPGGPSRPRVG